MFAALASTTTSYRCCSSRRRRPLRVGSRPSCSTRADGRSRQVRRTAHPDAPGGGTAKTEARRPPKPKKPPAPPKPCRRRRHRRSNIGEKLPAMVENCLGRQPKSCSKRRRSSSTTRTCRQSALFLGVAQRGGRCGCCPRRRRRWTWRRGDDFTLPFVACYMATPRRAAAISEGGGELRLRQQSHNWPSVARQQGHPECARMPLKAKASVNLARVRGITPLFSPARRLPEVCSADAQGEGNGGLGSNKRATPLVVAAQTGNEPIVRLLLEEGPQ